MPPRPLPKIALLKMEYVLDFFAPEHFAAWPEPVEIVTFHWEDDGSRFVEAVRKAGIDIIIGNIPATAYDRFVPLGAALPGVRFIPSLKCQAINRSKEATTLLCREHGLPHPETWIFHDAKAGEAFLEQTIYPKLIRRSYGPSNFGSYHSHLVRSADEARAVIREEKYAPLYLQEPVVLRHDAEFRVVLADHQPVWSYWHRDDTMGPLEIDEAPAAALELAAAASRAAETPYCICSIAVERESAAPLLLECSTAFAAPDAVRRRIAGSIVAALLGTAGGISAGQGAMA